MGDNDTHGSERQRVWFSLDRTRRFLVPEQVSLAEGGYPIRDLTGQQRAVDPVQLGNFEVSVAAADAWAKAELGRVLRAFGGNLRRSFASVPPSADGPAYPPEAPVTPGLDLLAAITNTPRADLDAGALGAALKRYFGDIGATVADAVSGDPACIDRAKERMAEWSATLREHGTEVGEPQPTAGAAPDAGRAADAASARAATEPQEQPGTVDGSGFAARLRELAEQFRRRADALAAAQDRVTTPPAAPEVGPGDPPSPAEAAQPTSAARLEPVAAEGRAQTTPSASSAAPAFDQSEPSSRAETQAAALEALAAGLEDAAGDAAARLRARASRLRRGS